MQDLYDPSSKKNLIKNKVKETTETVEVMTIHTGHDHLMTCRANSFSPFIKYLVTSNSAGVLLPSLVRLEINGLLVFQLVVKVILVKEGKTLKDLIKIKMVTSEIVQLSKLLRVDLELAHIIYLMLMKYK